jgi:hypothetical protein
MDETNKSVEAAATAAYLIEIQFLERYRSGHNGTDSKSVEGFTALRGFESLPLRHIPDGLNTAAF